MSIELDKIHLGNCMELMEDIPGKSVDMILCDLPYGITSCSWDKKLNLPDLWSQYNRIIKENGAVVLTATLGFGIELINSNRKNFRYDWVWEKSLSVGFANAKRMPLRKHELVLVFYKKLPTYNPQGLIELEKPIYGKKSGRAAKGSVYKDSTLQKPYVQRYSNYPKSILSFPNGNANSLHPTQKPVELFKYLIRTYTNEGEVVLDNCMGSGTTAVAALETGRRFIGFELNEEYHRVATGRVNTFFEKIKAGDAASSAL